MRTLVTFRATGFNTSDVGENFFNEDNFGEDVAKWLVQQLKRMGVSVDPEIGQEDHGWYFTYTADGKEYDFIVGYRDNDGPEWIGWIERSVGLVSSVLGGRRRGISSRAAAAIHNALAASPAVSNVAWHVESEFRDGAEDRSTRQPDT